MPPTVNESRRGARETTVRRRGCEEERTLALSPEDAPHDAGWPLIAPVRGELDRVLDKLPVEDPWSVPRAGLGGALVIHIARGLGGRYWKDAARAAATAVEAYNQRVFRGAPDAGELSRWLGQDLTWIRRATTRILRRDDALIRQVGERLTLDHRLGDQPIPEMVIFLRMAGAAGVLVGAVPDDDHARLDRVLTWLGLLTDPQLDPRTWAGALAAIGAQQSCGDDPRAHARAALHAAIGELPDGVLSERLLEMAAAEPAPAVRRRHFELWEPARVRAVAPRSSRPGGDDPLSVFRRRWREPIEETLRAVVETRSDVVGRALLWLQNQGGKRMRPLLTLAAAQAAGGAPEAALVPAAMIEWLHQGSLLIDDILDGATVRRGMPPLHVEVSVPFALGVAAWTVSRLHGALGDFPSEIAEELLAAATELAEGERAELRHTADAGLDQAGYEAIIGAKTARLFQAAAAVGGLAVNAERAHVAALERYGASVGLAFQIIDDLLDYTGTAERLGKAPGTDLRERKVTLPVLLLREELNGAERRHLDALLFGDPQPPGGLAWVRLRLAAYDIPDACLAHARAHRATALQALQALPQRTPAAAAGVAALTSLADRVIDRTR